MRPRRVVVALVLTMGVLGLLGGCKEKQARNDSRPTPLTRSQRDSVIAASQLPGARVVGRARALADSARARAKRLDALQP